MIETSMNKCEFCKSKDIVILDLNFKKCNTCNCIFNQNFNDGKKLLLDHKSYTHNSLFSKISNPIKMRFWNIISKEYMNYLSEKTDMKFKNALDIGALYGHLVHRLNEHGISSEGIEVEQNYISNGVSDKIHLGYFDENFQSNKKYDLICMTQMIYYVKNPTLVLKHANELLSNSGIIFISTQNPTSPIMTNKQYSIFENSMNIILSKKNLLETAENLNLKIVDLQILDPIFI